MNVNISEFKSCSNCPPTEEGYYLVVSFRGRVISYASVLNFIPGYGWNVSKNCRTGEVDTRTVITFDYEPDMPEYWWASATISLQNSNTQI